MENQGQSDNENPVQHSTKLQQPYVNVLLKGIKDSNVTLEVLPSAIFSCLFSFALVCLQKVVIAGDIFSANDEAYFEPFNPLDFFKWILYFAVIMVILHVVGAIADRAQTRISIGRKPKISVFFVFAAILFMCWLPCLLTFYPGGIYSDTIQSLHMAAGESRLSNHNPILYTLSWRFVLWVGELLHLEETASFFLYTILQTIAMASAGAYCLYILYLKGMSKIFIILSLAWFALFHLIPLYCVSLWKDTPFAVITLILTTFLLNVFWRKKDEKIIYKTKTLTIYSVLAFLFCFSRNNGFYAFLLFSLVLISYFVLQRRKRTVSRKHFRIILVLSCVLVAGFSVLRGPVYDKLGFNGSDTVESLGIPIQQTAYVIVNGGNVPAKDIEIINEIMPITDLRNEYRPLIVDTLKWSGNFNTDVMNQNRGAFMKAYIDIVCRNPGRALKGYLLASEGMWDPTRQTLDAYVNNFMWNGLPYQITDLPAVWFGFSLKNSYSTRILYSSALFAWVLFAMQVVGLRRRRGGSVLPLVPAMGIWVTVMIATPIAFSLRYMFPLILLIPAGAAVMCGPGYSQKTPACGGSI